MLRRIHTEILPIIASLLLAGGGILVSEYSEEMGRWTFNILFVFLIIWNTQFHPRLFLSLIGILAVLPAAWSLFADGMLIFVFLRSVLIFTVGTVAAILTGTLIGFGAVLKEHLLVLTKDDDSL